MATLFCYGTLALPGVVKRLIGRVPDGVQAKLENYVCRCIRDTDFPALVPRKKSEVTGTLYRNLSPQEIRILDDYEGQMYKRQQVWVELDQGKTEHSWVYVLRSQYYSKVLEQPWDVEKYLRFSLEKRA
ncbi:MAG: gamma-glutamylcyclotransferase [Motiliproteus sp.]|nr:gamma-glutamylcyclotransferase [Motiliproteus sp.]MCW9054273.1 gamma-glutamylcyclotransferase [Motiliproteus sp.]